MQIGQIETKFGKLNVHQLKYHDGGAIAIACSDMRDEPYATLSVNIPEYPLGDREFLAKTWSENAQLAQDALASGLFEDTGKRVPTGYVEAQVWRIK